MNNLATVSPPSRTRTKFHWPFIRIGLWASLAVLIMLIVVGLWSYQQTNQLVRQTQTNSAHAFTTGLANALEGQIIVRDLAQVELQLLQAMSSEQVESILVADRDGTILSEVSRDPQTGKPRVVFSDAGKRFQDRVSGTERQEDTLKIVSPIGNALNVGWLRLQFVTTRDTALLKGIHEQLLMIISLGAAIMLTIVGFSLRRTYSQVKSNQNQIEDLNENLHSVAYYDPLTRLPNRPLLRDRLNQALALSARSHQQVAVCYVDLDGFKAINDTYGHDAGDIILVEVAKRLTLTVRQHDTVGRIGGDEFVIVLNGIESIHVCQHLMDRILIELTQPIDIGHHVVTVGASIGVALSSEHGINPNALITLADKAMYRAKANGRNQCCYYSSLEPL